MHRVCIYVTAHGFGHAARCQAVAELLLEAGVAVEFRTGAPRWFFDWLLAISEQCILRDPGVILDPGVVQSDSFSHDVPATLHAWQHLLARADELCALEATYLRGERFDVVVSDVAPLPLAAARQAGLPAVAMGNFTWDWVLEGYLQELPEFSVVIDGLRALYSQADLFLRLPMSHPTELFQRERQIDFTTRRSHLPPDQIRRLLGVDPEHLMVLLSFGGFGVKRLDLQRVSHHRQVRCVWDQGPAQPPALISARGMGLRYTDLVRAADVVLTKPGYSIISEAVAQQTPLAFAPRRGFRESSLLESFLRSSWPSLAVEPEALANGTWIEPVVRWLANRPRIFPHIAVEGARQASQAILELA